MAIGVSDSPKLVPRMHESATSNARKGCRMEQGNRIRDQVHHLATRGHDRHSPRIRCQLSRHLVVKTRVGYPAVRKPAPWRRLRLLASPKRR